MLSKPRIVCAANRCKLTQQMLIGARHWDHAMRCQYRIIELRENLLDSLGEPIIKYNIATETQGFIDQHNRFYTREEAWKIAEENNQIICRVGGDTRNGGTLYSENLY